MKTRKPIATISYNSDGFLTTKLEELRRAKIISVWFFINHVAENDEKKDHKHLWIFPAKTIQTDDLVDELLEPDLSHPDKPLKCLHFQSCNSFADWYLYALHDKSYLLRKGQKRAFSYSIDDMVCSDRDELDEMVRQIDMTDFSAMGRLIDAKEQGLTFDEYVRRGSVPVQMFSQYLQAWEYLDGRYTERNGRKTHTPSFDPLTGELVD